MARIHILDSETIDKIAAGEVVERPASVVKELVENAMDAGATAITVEAKDGGIEFIRVTDNGTGIEAEQIRKAFLRHATSKIENADDLSKIASLGFRGEALSSIAAVSKVELLTKRRDSLVGNRLILEGAVEKAFEEVGVPEGTTFLVRNLFFNTPVRRKFLKQPATEGGYITDLMEHMALSRPDISFKFILGNQTRFHTSGNGDLKEVIYRIYGREIASSLIPIQETINGVTIEGYLGKPILVRSNRNFEIYFINGRFIRSTVIAKALEEGYREYLMQHKFPLCVLHISMDSTMVDVNVHPTKMDVRFSDTIGFSRLLSEAVHKTLKRQEMIPTATLLDDKEEEKRKKAALLAARKEHTPEMFETKRDAKYRVMESAKYQAVCEPASGKIISQKQEFAQNPVWSRVLGNSAREDVEASDSYHSESGIPKEASLKADEVGNTLRSQIEPDKAEDKLKSQRENMEGGQEEAPPKIEFNEDEQQVVAIEGRQEETKPQTGIAENRTKEDEEAPFFVEEVEFANGKELASTKKFLNTLPLTDSKEHIGNELLQETPEAVDNKLTNLVKDDVVLTQG
ncbi:MAG: DNA mismatch repair endonuclease MutL, partial [Lachnospiraceae bacterium]|nr:DNA mismatch repair endonuclease MutL [Lachnospiraceae bacterium]